MEDSFKDWLEGDEWGYPALVEGMVALHLRMKKYWEAGGQPITLNRGQMDFPLKFAGRHLDNILPKAPEGQDRVIKGPDQNYLVPVDSILPPGPDGKTPKGISHFVRDMPYIGAFCQGSAENMASAIIFVLLTIRADFMQVMHSFPIIMTLLMSKFQNGIQPGQLEQAMFDMEGKLAAASHSKVRSKNDAGKVFRKGYGNGGQLFGKKYEGVTWVWNNRDQFYSECMNYVAKKDTVGVFKYIATKIKGIAQPKAGFCVQLIFGELGCIDMHNVNLYSQYYLDRGQPKSATQRFTPDTMRGQSVKMPAFASGQRDIQAYKSLNPKSFSPSINDPGAVPGAGASARDMNTYANRSQRLDTNIKAYIDVLQMLEKDGFNTIKLWDIWVSYVSNYYTKKDGSTRYARDGIMAGNPMDPENDDTDARIMQTRGPIPDRNTATTNSSNVIWKPDPRTGEMVPWKKPTKKGAANGAEPTMLPSSSVDGMDKEDSAGAASLSHGAIHWWRNPDYWWDLVSQAQGNRPKDGVRYASDQFAGPVSDVPRALPYIDQNPEMLQALFPDSAERKQFKSAVKDVLRKHDFYGQQQSSKPSQASRWHKAKKSKHHRDQGSFDFGD